MRRWTLAGAALTLIVLGAFKLIPAMNRDRVPTAATPTLTGFSWPITPTVAPGKRACIKPVPLLPEARTVQVLAIANGKPEPLVAELSGPGYEEQAAFATEYPLGGPTMVEAQIARPPAQAIDGRVCIRNAGKRPVQLVGTGEPISLTNAVSTVDGKVVPSVFVMFLGNPESGWNTLPSAIAHATALADGPPQWIVWLVAIAAVPALAGGGVLALWLAERPTQRRSDG